jgi:transposase
VGPTKRGKGTKIMAIADKNSLPVAVSVAAASPHEVTLVEGTLAARFTRATPPLLVGDRAYDSDPLDAALKRHDVLLIAPHRGNRRRRKTQDGRQLRRYRKRWRIERLFAWLQNYRRIVTRYEYHPANFLAFIHLACIIILLRHFH